MATLPTDLLSPTSEGFSPEDLTHHRFARQVTLNPDAIAIRCGEQSVSYSALNERANRIAHRLIAHGVRAGDLVSVCVERGADMAAAVLAVLKAGAAYVPVDPAYPADRTAFVLRDAVANVVIAQKHVAERLGIYDRQLVLLEDDFADESPADLYVEVSEESPAYVIYTSGSTGEPKGVVITHANLSNYLNTLPVCVGVTGDDVYLHTASIAFSSSVRQLFVPLTCGATVVIAPRAMTENPVALFREVQRTSVTVVDFVPSYWRVCNQALKSLSPDERAELLDNQLRLVLSASEPLPTDVVQEWRTLGNKTQLINMFGQTETTGIVATFPIPPDLSELGSIVPVGHAIPNMQLYVLDANGASVPAGSVGEVYVSGGGVGAGYLNRPEMTTARFLPDISTNGRMYRTGDHGRVRADGSLEFVGRADDQVKIRGFRVELEEVEAALRSYPSIREAAVAARPDATGNTRLVAYVACTAAARPTVAQLRGHLQRILPDYMIPTQFAVVGSLPRSPNGKLDRRSLREPDETMLLGSDEYVAPRSPTEQSIAAIWADVLEVPRVGLLDGFLELGGHSLMAHRVAVRLREKFDVDVPLRDILQATTVEQLARFVEAARVSARAAALPQLTRVERKPEMPLSSAQQRLWLLNQMNPESTAYNLCAALRLNGDLNVPALEQTLSEIVNRHESLRTVFPSHDGAPVQAIQPAQPVKLQVIDTAHTDAEIEQLATEEVQKVFDLATGPLLRALLLQKSRSEHVLVLTMHHIVSDGWSRGVLYREIAEIYSAFAAGDTSPCANLAVQYVDVAECQKRWLDSGVMASQLDYWKRQLRRPLPVLELPADRPRPPVQSTAGATWRFTVPPVVLEQLRTLSAQESATLFMTLLAAYQTLLFRYSGNNDVVVGSPIAGRSRVESEALIGFFVNTLVMRSDLSGQPTFRELLNRVRQVAHEAYEHQDMPFERLVEELGLPRDASRTPIFQTMFILQNTPTRPMRLRGLKLEHLDLDTGASKFDLTLSLTVDDTGLLGSLEYNTDLFEPETIERISDHYRALLEGIVANPDARITELPLLGDRERTFLLGELNATAVAAPTDVCVHEQIERQVERTPCATAVIFEDASLTYRQLNERANQVAHHLINLGIGPGALVGICVPRSVEMAVGLLGILKAGAAYVPLDPSYPRDRLAGMIEDSEVPIILTVAELASQIPATNARLVQLDADAAFFKVESNANPRTGVGPTNLAYVIYTSGSTGKPKGVMIEHCNVVNFFTGMDARVGSETPGTWLAVTSISFDISVLELFWTLARGFKVVIQSEAGILAGGRTPRSDRKIDFGLFYFASNEKAHDRNKYQLLLEGARFADANGFTSVWTPERHFHAFGGLYPNPSVTSAAIAAITTNVQIRAGSVVLPLHSPIRIAEEWAMVDNLSNGRVGIAFASGWHDRDFVFAPQNYADRRNVMMNGINTVRELWRGNAVKATTGAGVETDVRVLPRPIQPELPIWVTAAGTADTYRAAGEIGANVLTHLLGQTVEQLREKIEIYRQAWRTAGHAGHGVVSLMMHTFVGDDVETVRALVHQPFREYLRTSVGLIKELAEGRGQDLRASSFTAADMEALLDHAFERYWQTSALLGTPESCLEVINNLKQIGVDEVACLIDFGVDEAAVMDSLGRLLELKNLSNRFTAPAAAGDYSIAAQITRHRVTHMQCTPSLAAMLMAQPDSRSALANLSKLMIGGEAFPAPLAAEIRRATPAEILNMYGPTETTIWSSTQVVAGDESQVPLGKPIANTQFYVLDANLQPVPIGVAGELFIGGAGVVRGYLNRVELTHERFIRSPFQRTARLYRTGDLVRYRADGSLDFLGRTDFQVKIHGHRIELGEIEATIGRQPEVRECVVSAREDDMGDKRLVAYLLKRDGTQIDVTTLRQVLRAKLPEFMVPAHFVVLPELPRTPNNKIDRNALPAPDVTTAATAVRDLAPPVGELERTIAGIWQQILRVTHVGANDNFFDLGGNSFLAVRVHAHMREALNTEMPLTTLFRFPTVSTIAAHLNGSVPAAENSNGPSGQDRAELRRQALQRRRQQVR